MRNTAYIPAVRSAGSRGDAWTRLGDITCVMPLWIAGEDIRTGAMSWDWGESGGGLGRIPLEGA